MSTAKYERIRAVGNEHYNEKGDCGVVALAIACNVSYGKAQAALARAGRKPRCGTQGTAMITAAKELGFMAQYFSRRADHPTVNKVKEEIVGAALVLTRGHVSAVVDGIVHDYIGQRSRKRAIGIINITPYEGASNA